MQSSLIFDETEEKKAQVQTTTPMPEKTSDEPYKETTVDKFKEKKMISLGEIKSQMDAVLYHMQQEGFITSWDGFKEWGITRMSSIIHTLRHKHKIEIESEDVITENRFKHSTRYSKYKLKQEAPAP